MPSTTNPSLVLKRLHADALRLLRWARDKDQFSSQDKIQAAALLMRTVNATIAVFNGVEPNPEE